MTETRTKNTSRNIVAGLINRAVSTLLPFINRTILIYTLGMQYAGLSSLFLSILSVLSLAELGFNTAIVYSMYKPIANDDTESVCELLTLFRKIYFYVGITILFFGLMLVPFLPRLINGEIPASVNIYILYFLYLSNTVIGYFLFSYRESILLACQRQDLSQMIRTSVIIFQYVIQALILLIFKSFYLYLIIAIICTLLTNIGLYFETKKRYPNYKCLKHRRLTVPNKMKTMVGSLLLGRICDQARNSLDSIILSMYLGLTLVAIYNNYYFIYSALYGIILTICNSLSASVGNSIVTESVEKNYDDLNKFSFMAMWVYGLFSICMLCMYQPFMQLWVGKTMMLSDFNMLLFCVYFYIINMSNIRNQYINGNGLWNKLRITYIVEAVSNITLNIVLGKLYGVTGIILATILTMLFFNFLWRTAILFKNYFSWNDFYAYILKNFFWMSCVFVTGIATFCICEISSLLISNLLIKLLINLIFCIIFSNGMLYLCFFKTTQFKNTKSFCLRLFRNRR